MSLSPRADMKASTCIFSLCMAALAGIAAGDGTITPPPDIPSPTACPTLVETKMVCSTCRTAPWACLISSTVTAGCGCPDPPATRTTSYPCGVPGGCDGLSCYTSYAVKRVTDCPGPTTCKTLATITQDDCPSPANCTSPPPASVCPSSFTWPPFSAATYWNSHTANCTVTSTKHQKPCWGCPPCTSAGCPTMTTVTQPYCSTTYTCIPPTRPCGSQDVPATTPTPYTERLTSACTVSVLTGSKPCYACKTCFETTPPPCTKPSCSSPSTTPTPEPTCSGANCESTPTPTPTPSSSSRVSPSSPSPSVSTAGAPRLRPFHFWL